MVFRNQKPQTKDVDLLFQNSFEAGAFCDALIKLGYERERILKAEYSEMNAAGGIWRRPDGSRFDSTYLASSDGLG